MSSFSKRGFKNVAFGLLNQFITIAFGLILPRLFITSYGSEVNGLISSVNQIYVYAALLEAGVGGASLQALYKTIAAEDKNATNGVMSATHHFYKRTGAAYFAVVVILSVVYPLIVPSDIDNFTISAVVVLSGMGGVLNYFFQGKYQILLRAEGKNYLLSNVSTVVYTATSITKITLIWLGFDVVIMLAACLVVNILQMGYILFHIKRHYKWVDLSVEPDNEAISSKNAVMVHQIAGMVFNNTDILILTFLSGLKTVSVYALYNSFYNMVKSILYSFLNGITFILGQTFNSDFEKFKEMQEIFEACYITLTFTLYSILFVLIIPFMKLYTEGITDINYNDPSLALLFTLVFLLQGARGPMELVSNYACHFKQTQHQAIIESVINLSVSIACVITFGLYGVLFGTIAALLYRANAIIWYVNRKILDRSPLVTYSRWGWCALVFVAIFALSNFCVLPIDSYLTFVIYAVPVSALIVLAYSLGLRLFEKRAFCYVADSLKKRIVSSKY